MKYRVSGKCDGNEFHMPVWADSEESAIEEAEESLDCATASMEAEPWKS